MFAIINENPVEWLEKYGDYLFGFAMSRLHNETAAEDLVQETLLAALQSQQKFSNNSSEKTWLTAILKNKIIDHYRRSIRQVSFASDEEETDFFDNQGNWREVPTDWRETPEGLFERREFAEILQNCLADLPKNLAAVFTLREIEGLETKQICEILNLSPNNFWVMLHRARLQLRQSLENRWFGKRQETLMQTGEFVFAN
jgi:RNA polymerase sigma-70 factor (ECF subfamily)